MIEPPPMQNLFPYTTLFRSPRSCFATRAAYAPARSRNEVTAFASTSASTSGLPLPDLRTLGHLVANSLGGIRSEEHTSELQSLTNLVCRLLLEKKNVTEIEV